MMGFSSKDKCVVGVDLIPFYSDSKNGGCKPAIVELLKGLIRTATQEKYILFTSEENHNSFLELEKLGAQRVLIAVPLFLKISRRLIMLLQKILTRLPLIRRVGSFLVQRQLKLEEGYSKNILNKTKVSVLFVPLHYPFYAQPTTPTVMVVNDIQDCYYPEFFSTTDLASRSFFHQMLQTRASHVVAISQFTKDSLVEKLSLLPEKISVIHISIQQRFALPSPDKTSVVLKKYNLTDKKYFYFPANFWHHKNHKNLLAAFRIFLDQVENKKDYCLVFSGNTLDKKSDISTIIEKLQLQQYIRILGFLPDAEMACIWSGCFALVFPSLFEGFGIPVVESMMFGKPVLCSQCTSLPEVCLDAAIYFDPFDPQQIANALLKINSDPALYKTLQEKGKARSQFFQSDEMVEKYRTIFTNIYLEKK